MPENPPTALELPARKYGRLTTLPYGQCRGSYKLSEDNKMVFLATYAQCGRLADSAKAAGVTLRSINYHREDNPDFEEDVVESRETYKATLEAEIHRRAIEGWDEPVFGGKFKDEIVGYVRRYSDRLLELHAKRHIPEYRDKIQVDAHVSGGVLVVPGVMPDPDEWRNTFNGDAERVDSLPPPGRQVVRG